MLGVSSPGPMAPLALVPSQKLRVTAAAAARLTQLPVQSTPGSTNLPPLPLV